MKKIINASEDFARRQERIYALTMKKIKEGKKEQRTAGKPIRWAAAGVAAALALTGTAFAAYENGWFGFDRIFGEKTELVQEGVVTYSDTENLSATLPSYTEEEQAMIEDGTMIVPEQAELADSGISSSTEAFQFTLEEMLAGEDSLFAVLRMDARTEAAESELTSAELDFGGDIWISMINEAGEGNREKEKSNGGMDMQTLSNEDGTAYFLLTNTGGIFSEGDMILFQYYGETGATDLFEVPLERLAETREVVNLDASLYENKGYRMDTMTITPISLEIEGSYTVSPDQSTPVVQIRLKNGVSFELASIANGFQYTPYGQYGSLSYGGTAGGMEDPFIRDTWAFSQIIDPEEIEKITVDGVDYTLE